MRSYLCVVCGVVGLYASMAHSAESVLVNGLAVKVNDSIITRQDVMEATADNERSYYLTYRSQPLVFEQKRDQLRRDALDLLIERQLILDDFKQLGYKLPENLIEEQIKNTIRRDFGDRASMVKTLQTEGLTMESYRQRVKERFIIDAMTFKNISSEIIISPYKIESYYAEHGDEFKVEDQVKLRMIVLNNRPNRDAAATRKMAEEILKKIEGGSPFAGEATDNSDGSQAKQGGDWGWVNRSTLRPDLAEVAFSLKPGERSAVIEKPDGCYLMLVEDAHTARVRPLSEVRDEIEKNLLLKEQQRLRKQWMDRLKSKSFIQYFPAG